MSLKDCRESQEVQGLSIIDDKVLPEGAWFNDWRPIDEEGKERLHVEVLLVETFILEVDLVEYAFSPVVQGEVAEL